MSRHIREGERSFYENNGRYSNPYERGSAQYNDFERDFFQAQRKSSGDRPYNRAVALRAQRTPTRVPHTQIPTFSKKQLPDDIYQKLAKRAREKLPDRLISDLPGFKWPSYVYYIRVETYFGPLWKIGVTCNDLASRYCVADRRIIVKVKSWQYETRVEAVMIERAILAEFARYLYEGDPVLRSGGNGELFTRDVLDMDAQDDYRAIARRERATRHEDKK